MKALLAVVPTLQRLKDLFKVKAVDSSKVVGPGQFRIFCLCWAYQQCSFTSTGKGACLLTH